MKPFEHILILSDLDNTFLGKRSRIVEENLVAIERFKAQGGKFAFATGRDPYALLRVAPTAAQIANYPCIVTNGAYCYDLAEKKAYDEHPLNTDGLLEIVDKLLQNHPDVSLRFSTDTQFITPRYDHLIEKHLSGFLDLTRQVPLSEIAGNYTLYKAVFCGHNEELLALRDEWLSYQLPGYCSYFSCNVLFEILDLEGTKGQRVDFLRHLCPAITTVYGVGDHENDMQLLQSSDIAACPANAIDSVKRNSHVFLCDHDEGAIADLIHRIEHSSKGEIL